MMSQTASIDKLAYLVTVSSRHVIPAFMLIASLQPRTAAKIYVVGKVAADWRACFEAMPQVIYIDEDEIDLAGRAPHVNWSVKHREWGWYKQMFVRLSIDRYIPAEQVVVLDSEVFMFTNWDERRLYTATGNPKCFYWISQQRKPDWDYTMYRAAAYPYQGMSGFEDVMEYANSDHFRRHISGVVLFSTANVRHIWTELGRRTDVERSFHDLFNGEPDLSFSDHDFYGIAIDYGLCDDVVKTELVPELLGWYDNHQDPVFDRFAFDDPMWSMCQRYFQFPGVAQYYEYMLAVTAHLQRQLYLAPEVLRSTRTAGQSLLPR